MKPLTIWFLAILFGLNGFQSFSQTVYLTEKQGNYTYFNNTASRGKDYITFGENVKKLSDYFYQNIPIMKANKGFDLSVTLFGYWDDYYKKWDCNYGLRGELTYRFQLFSIDSKGKEGKWTIEPPE